MVTSFQLSVEPSCLIVETGVRCFLTFHALIAHLVALLGIFLPQLSSIPMVSTVLHYTQVSELSALLHFHAPLHTSVAVAGSMLNDRLIPITTSYRVVVVVERGGPIIHQRVSPGDIVNVEDYHDEATENPMYQTYTRVLHW